MTKRIKQTLALIGILLLVLYVTGAAVLYFCQGLLLFHPTALSKNHQYLIKQPFAELNIKQNDGTNLALVKFLSPGKKGIVLYFHGNKRNVEWYASLTEQFTKKGYELWMMDYRGFGKSTGKLTEQGLYDDALSVYKLAVLQNVPDNIIIYGKSLGTGIAAQLAATQKCKTLILETPYYNILQIAKDKFPIYPVSWLLKYSIPTHKFLPNVSAPVVAFHGTADEVISYNHARKLKEENPHIDLLTVQKGRHNNLFSNEAVVKKLDQVLDN